MQNIKERHTARNFVSLFSSPAYACLRCSRMHDSLLFVRLCSVVRGFQAIVLKCEGDDISLFLFRSWNSYLRDCEKWLENATKAIVTKCGKSRNIAQPHLVINNQQIRETRQLPRASTP
jgi:hypothetical protein